MLCCVCVVRCVAFVAGALRCGCGNKSFVKLREVGGNAVVHVIKARVFHHAITMLFYDFFSCELSLF